MTMTETARIDELRAALDRVTDPELDESVVGLGFVTGLTASEDGAVSIGFRLPTYWCAANFSYLMAADMREAALSLPWVRSVRVELDTHMYGDTINEGVNAGRDFRDAFGDAADQDLSEIRLIFGLKSFERRQEALLRHLLAAGLDGADLAALDLDGLAAIDLDPEGATLRARYLERRPMAGGEPLAFVTRDGETLMAETLGVYLRHLRRVGLNAEFNGALCRGLLAARYRDAPKAENGEPELADFIAAAADRLQAPPERFRSGPAKDG